MRNIFVILLVLIVICGGGYLVYNQIVRTNTINRVAENNLEVSGVQNTVEMRNMAFSPKSITIKAGESVTFKNTDLVGHTATADDKSWTTQVIANGESETVKFDKPGTYTYFCKPHPFMKGTIVVE